jgi:ribosomal-protein-alanine N-acetyltransferase
MLKHNGTIKIETERLLLRRFTIDDADCMFNNWASDSEICKYMRWEQHENKEETMNVISRWVESYNKKSFYQWAITLKENKEAIGAISLFTVNEYDLCGDVGYCIGKEYWGQGIATEALKAVLKYAFEIIGFNRIETYHSINNPASGRVMQKCGMRFEGLARQKYKSVCSFEDSNMYSILKEDFMGIKQPEAVIFL